MRKAGVSDYEAFAQGDPRRRFPTGSISFEVFADDFAEMERQARRIATWGKHVSVKIPITNTKRESAIPLVRKLSQDGIALNVTAMFTLEQVQEVVDAVQGRRAMLMSRSSPVASPTPASIRCRSWRRRSKRLQPRPTPN